MENQKYIVSNETLEDAIHSIEEKARDYYVSSIIAILETHNYTILGGYEKILKKKSIASLRKIHKRLKIYDD